MESRGFFDRKDENVVVEELSSLTIPEDQMVTVQEEIITTVDNDPIPPKHEPVLEEVMDEGQAPKRDPDQIAAIEKRRKLTLKPKPSKSEMEAGKKRKMKGAKKEKRHRRVSAYLLYSRHMRSSVAKEFPELKGSEITCKLGKMWSELDDADKEYWKTQEIEENSNVSAPKKKKKRMLAPLPPDGPPEALDLAAHLKLLGDSITKMGEITSELYEREGYRELTVSALLTNLLDCLLCASAPLIYLSSHIEQLNVIPVESQIKMLDNVAYIMPGLENFKS